VLQTGFKFGHKILKDITLQHVKRGYSVIQFSLLSLHISGMLHSSGIIVLFH